MQNRPYFRFDLSSVVFFSTGFPAWDGRGDRLSSRNKMSQSVDGVVFVLVPLFLAKSMKHYQKKKQNKTKQQHVRRNENKNRAKRREAGERKPLSMVTHFYATCCFATFAAAFAAAASAAATTPTPPTTTITTTTTTRLP